MNGAASETSQVLADPEIILRQVESVEHCAIARDLFLEYADAIGTDLAYQGFSAELATLPGPYQAPSGALLIAYVKSDVAGCVALRPIDTHTGEMKRLYVRSVYRQYGLGKRLVQAVIDTARGAGYKTLVLDTLPSMTSAQALYSRLGFVEIRAYNTTHLPGTRFYSLKLDDYS